jgi:hypothetical protein
MQTVNVLRKGQVQIEWVDSSILNKANDKPAAEDSAEEAKAEEGKEAEKKDGDKADAKPDEKAEDAENKEEGAVEEKLMCTQPPPGMRSKWAPQQVILATLTAMKNNAAHTRTGPAQKQESVCIKITRPVHNLFLYIL